MPYVLLITEPAGQRQTRSDAEGHAAYDSMVRFTDGLKARGLHIASDSLRSDRHGVRVQVRSGTPRVVDGPFAEAKEMVGGFFLLNCATLDEAIAIAHECPAAAWATVEVRETGPCHDG